MSTPRIQFRLSKEKDDDLIMLFEQAENTTELAKRLIRQGIAYENMKKGKIIVASNEGIIKTHSKDIYVLQT